MNNVEQCCSYISSIIDGKEGFLKEFLAIVLFVFIFNFVAKWLLNRLENNFKNKNKIWHESFVQAIISPLSYYVWYFAILHLIDIISQKVFEKPLFSDLNLFLKLGFVLTLTWFFLRWKKNIMKIMFKKSKNHEIALDTGKLDVINKLITIALFFVTFLTLLEVTHSSLNTLIAFGGVGGLALAFASQEIIANFFSGAMIYLTQPFLVGDQITVPEKNIEGYVEEIGWYMTRIRTIDKRPIYIPNSLFSKIVVINPSRMTHRFFKETFGLRYEDMPKITPLIQEIKTMLQNHKEIDNRQKIAVYLNTFATYSIDLLVSAYTKTTSSEAYFELRQDLLVKIYEIIERHGAKAAVPITYVEIANEMPSINKKDISS